MAWNKEFNSKKPFYKQTERAQYKPKRGKLSLLMTEEEKSFDELRINVMAYTYILRLSNGKYYVGSTYNLQNRLREHSVGHDFYTKAHLPVELVYFEEYPTKEEAAKREYQLKGWSREKKENLISGKWTKI